MLNRNSIFLIGSLALNAALLGIVGGKFAGGSRSVPEVNMEFERYGPTSDVVAAAWEQLPDNHREKLQVQLVDQWNDMEPERKRLHDAGTAVYQAALAEPFDKTELRNTVVVFQSIETRLQRNAEDILINYLGKMPPEARATAAVGLLTPFSARSRRADEGQEAPASDGGGAANAD